MDNEGSSFIDDGLFIPDVGNWEEEKHRLVALYASLFSTGMKHKWDERVYLDLYASAGLSRVRGTNRIIPGSPLLALRVSDSFDKYIFCEREERRLSALKSRVQRFAPEGNVAYVAGDCNQNVNAILREIPSASAKHTVLTLCVVDPFDIGIKFETIRKLATRYVDFVCLLAVYMDARRAYDYYIQEGSTKVAEFLGKPHWRKKWLDVQSQPGLDFPNFLAEEFSSSMEDLGYIPPPLYSMKRVRSGEKNLPLYYLALFSRNKIAYGYWDEVLKYSTSQIRFDF